MRGGPRDHIITQAMPNAATCRQSLCSRVMSQASSLYPFLMYLLCEMKHPFKDGRHQLKTTAVEVASVCGQALSTHYTHPTSNQDRVALRPERRVSVTKHI